MNPMQEQFIDILGEERGRRLTAFIERTGAQFQILINNQVGVQVVVKAEIGNPDTSVVTLATQVGGKSYHDVMERVYSYLGDINKEFYGALDVEDADIVEEEEPEQVNA